MYSRISKETLLMSMAHLMSLRGTCSRLRVGCVIAKGGRVISTGYNGSAPGSLHCIDVGCELDERGHCIRTTHAETNAIVWAARNGLPTLGCDLYTTTSPCIICAKAIASAGIVVVHYQSEFREKRGIIYLEENGIRLIKHTHEETSFIRFSMERASESELHSV
jgi:dCMP deaminase